MKDAAGFGKVGTILKTKRTRGGCSRGIKTMRVLFALFKTGEKHTQMQFAR